MKPATILVRSENFVQRQLGEETVLVPISQTGIDVQNIYTLNETAAMVWKLLENKCTEEDVIAAKFRSDVKRHRLMSEPLRVAGTTLVAEKDKSEDKISLIFFLFRISLIS